MTLKMAATSWHEYRSQNETSFLHWNSLLLSLITEGPLCEWQSLGTQNPDNFDTFAAFRDAGLNRVCSSTSQPTNNQLTWTPNSDTPDTVYYQVKFT